MFSAPRQQNAPAGISGLTRRLTAGDEEAFAEFHRQYFDRLYQFLLVVARGHEDEAREALQETLVRVARRPRTFDDEEAFWCWLKTISRNAARDGGRKRGRYLILLKEFALRRQVDSLNGQGEDCLLSLLAESLAELPEADRQLVEGKYLRGETVRELARNGGLTGKAVESRLWRLRRELRARLLKSLSES